MAQRVSRTRSGASNPRAAHTKSRKPASAEVEVLEEEGQGDIETGIIITTTIVLLVAFLMVDHLRGAFGGGLFF